MITDTQRVVLPVSYREMIWIPVDPCDTCKTEPEPVPVDSVWLRIEISDKESGQKQSGISVRLDSREVFSGITGIVLFKLDTGSCSYTVSDPGYFTVDSSLVLTSDSLIQIMLIRSIGYFQIDKR